MLAPQAGRFYHKASPEDPAFVSPGSSLKEGDPLGLIEVMKTFNRVKYSGEPTKVARIVPEDGDDLVAGDVLLELEQ